MIFTPKGLSVSFLAARTCSLTQSAGALAAPMIPKPPALETAAALLKKKGITFDAEEMKVLIEAAVSEFNDAFHKPLLDAPTADATRRIVDDDREESGMLDDECIDEAARDIACEER